MSSMAIYLVGTVVVIAGLGYGAYLLHVPTQWIVVGGIVILGMGILGAVKNTGRRGPPK